MSERLDVDVAPVGEHSSDLGRQLRTHCNQSSTAMTQIAACYAIIV